MSRRFRIGVFVVFLLAAFSIQAQVETHPLTLPSDHYARSVFRSDSGSTLFPGKANPDISLQLGSSFLSMGKGNYGFRNFIRPGISYDLSQRFRLTTGIQFSSEQYTFAGSSDQESLFQGSYNRVSVFASGEYLINERVSIFGTAVKDLNTPQYRPMHPLAQDLDYQSLSVGVNYRLSDNVHFGAEVRFNNQPEYWFSNPYNSSLYRQRGSFIPDF